MPRKFRLSCSAILIFACTFIFILIANSRGTRWWELAHYETPVWSPDGRKVLYLNSTRAAEGGTLTILDRPQWPLFSHERHIEFSVPYPSIPAWRSNTEISIFTENITSLGKNPTYGPAMLHLYDIPSKTWNSFEAPLPWADGIAWHPDGSYAMVTLNPPHTSETLQSGVYKFTPATGIFELWLEAEMPREITWSPDGKYIAFLDLISLGNVNPPHLKIIEIASKEQVVFKKLYFESKSLEWYVSSDKGLSWSKNGNQIIAKGTEVGYQSQRDYDVHALLYFVPVDETAEMTSWELPQNIGWFDLSPSGEEIVYTSVTRPFYGTNTIHVLNLPEN